ncbi:tRNA (adenosine(37)-N6)-threonylcarbamoyltransferase complex ATPase subunit type 1 TsaE [Flavihumibacter sp.]|uniref:tRNA (adenosine(37)-N6)-threonylcarbamoyltransferase complex ATPase subunit type 1 TsaE n=1 Tax=Flavihumibacter sp. TaxID=1913981 RepID=UPI002FC6B5CE
MHLKFSLGELPAVVSKLISEAGTKRTIALQGSMGAGKTTLVHAFCDSLGVRDAVGSPTFSIINEYGTTGGPVYHIDCYRLRDEQEAIDAGVEDCLYSGNWCFVEWPEKIPHLLPTDTMRIFLEQQEDGSRLLTF